MSTENTPPPSPTIESLTAEVAALKEQITLLHAVGDVASLCMIDLSSNLRDAKKEYALGELPRGALAYVMSRYDNLHFALRQAGYTENNPTTDHPMRPGFAEEMRERQAAREAAIKAAIAKEKAECL